MRLIAESGARGVVKCLVFFYYGLASVALDANTGEVFYYLANEALTVQISSRGRIVSVVDTELGYSMFIL